MGQKHLSSVMFVHITQLQVQSISKKSHDFLEILYHKRSPKASIHRYFAIVQQPLSSCSFGVKAVNHRVEGHEFIACR